MVLSPLTKERVTRSIDSLILISSQIRGDYWTLEHYLIDLPGKWDLSQVLIENDAIAGFVIASIKNGAIHINRLVVDNNLKQNGLGKKLLEATRLKCKSLSMERITLKVHIDNFQAINWYFKQDFCIVGRADEYFELSRTLL